MLKDTVTVSRHGIAINREWREAALKALNSEATRPVELYAKTLLDTAFLNRTLLTDKQYLFHLNYAYLKTESLENRGINTENLHSTVTSKGERFWTPEREHLHKEVINEFLAQWENIPYSREAVLSGGLAGAGKTTTLTKHTHYNMDNYAFLSPDDVKEVMAVKGMFPILHGLTPMEVSALGYEESCHITGLLFQDCLTTGRNVIFDTTLGSHFSATTKLLPMREYEYSVSAVFVDIEIATSLRRSQERHRRGLNHYIITGEGNGGRLLPRYAVKRQVPEQPQLYSSRNREIFDYYREQSWFHESYLFDNNVDGRAPQLISLTAP